LYKFTSTLSEEEPEGAAAIGEWLEKRTGKEFFAFPQYLTEVYKKSVPKRRGNIYSLNRMFAGLSNDEETIMVDATRQVVSGYKSTAVLPFDSIILRFDPKSLALAPEECVVVALASRSWVQIFWALRHFHYSDWDTAVPDATNFQWSSEGALFLDDAAIARVGQRILTDFAETTRRRVATRWPNPTTESEEKSMASKDASNPKA
jgi:hypothetical protein